MNIGNENIKKLKGLREVLEKEKVTPIEKSEKKENSINLTDKAEGILEFFDKEKDGRKGLYPREEARENPEFDLFSDREMAIKDVTEAARKNGISESDIEYARNKGGLYSLVRKLRLKKEGKYKPFVKKEKLWEPREPKEVKYNESANNSRKLFNDARELLKNKENIFYADTEMIKVMEAHNIKTEGKGAKELLDELEEKIKSVKLNGKQHKESVEEIKVDDKKTKETTEIKVQEKLEQTEKEGKEFEGFDDKNIDSALEKTGKYKHFKDVISEQDKQNDQEAEEKGLYEKVTAMGKWYKKQPLTYKLMISAVFIGGAMGSAAIGGVAGGAVATAAFTGSVFQRILGGAATFVSLEGWMKNSAEKKAKKENREVSKNEEIKHKIIAGTTAVLVGSGAVGEALRNIYDFFSPEDIVEGAKEVISGSEKVKIEANNPNARSIAVMEHTREKALERVLEDAKVTSRAEELANKMGIELHNKIEYTEGHVRLHDKIEYYAEGHVPTIIDGHPVPRSLLTAEELVSVDRARELRESVTGNSLQNMTPEKGIESAGGVKINASTEATQGIAEQINKITVQKGDNLWKIIENKLAEKNLFDGMGEGQKTYLIDSLKDKFAGMSPDNLKEIGISSGNIDSLSVGDNIDLSKAFEGNFLHDSMNNAESLSREAISSIEANNDKIAEWVGNHPDETLTSEKVEGILKGGEYSNNLSENNLFGTEPTPEDIATADRIDSETAINQETQKIGGKELLEQVNTKFADDITNLYGSKGISWLGGFGGVEGLDSPEWAEIKIMKTDDVLGFDKLSSNEDGTKISDGVEKMKEYIKDLVSKTGSSPSSGENVEHFIRRSLETSIKR